MSYLTIYAHHNIKSIELDNIKIDKPQLNILKKLRVLLFG
jgi:hypothetical protein